MTSQERRSKIIEMLIKSDKPVSAAAIARECRVSRQIIVGDVALLRASGVSVCATPRGYVLEENLSEKSFVEKTIACQHADDALQDEIYTIIDNGGTLIDVTVEHSVYGQLSGKLHISSRYEADEFIKNLKNSQARPLCELTGGVHLHTIRCSTEDCFNRITDCLSNKGYLLSKE